MFRRGGGVEDKSERFDNEFMVIWLTHLHKPFVFLAGGDVATKKEKKHFIKVFVVSKINISMNNGVSSYYVRNYF